MVTQKDEKEEKKTRLKIVEGPGQWKAVLAAFGEKAGFPLTLQFEGQKKFVMFFSLYTFTTKRVDDIIKYEFTGRLANGMDAKGTYNPTTNKGWIEYYDEADEKKENEEKLKQILLLGQRINNLVESEYINFHWTGANNKRPTIKIISRFLFLNNNEENKKSRQMLQIIEKHLKRLGIPYSYERDEYHLIVELTSDCSIIDDLSAATL